MFVTSNRVLTKVAAIAIALCLIAGSLPVMAFADEALPDTTAPITTSDARASYVASARISLEATDGPTGSGVAHTWFELDGGQQTEGLTVTVSTTGTHTVQYWSADASGNVETPRNIREFTIAAAPDTSAPVTTCDAVASYAGTATIRLSATDDGGSGVAYTVYRLDGAHPVTGTVVTVTALGAHSLEYWSADKANNQESPHRLATFTVNKAPDTVPPTTTSNALTSYVGPANISLSAVDDPGGSGVARTFFRLNGVDFEGRVVVASRVGTNTLEYWSVDASGNVEPRNVRTFTVAEPPIVDPIAPTTTSDVKASYVESATIRLVPQDNAGGTGVTFTYYKLDGALWEGTQVLVTAVGTHTIEYWSVDKAGNIEASKTRTFVVRSLFSLDTVAPTTTSDARTSYMGSATITLAARDNVGGSGVASTHFRIDGVAWEGASVLVTKSGDHVLDYWSIDRAGNVENPVRRMFMIAATPPTTRCGVKTTYVESATISLVATRHAAGSMVLQTYFELDGVQWEGDTVVVTRIGSHVLTYWSVDIDGNVEAPQTVRFSIVKAKAAISIASMPTSARRGRSFSAYGYLAPRHLPGTWPVLLDCYRYQRGKWVRRKTVDAKVLDFGTRSRYSLRLSLPYAGRWRIRARHADAQHATSYSSYRYVTVR